MPGWWSRYRLVHKCIDDNENRLVRQGRLAWYGIRLLPDDETDKRQSPMDSFRDRVGRDDDLLPRCGAG